MRIGDVLYSTVENRGELSLASPEINPDAFSIIEFSERPQRESLDKLNKLGVNLIDYISGNAYSASMWIWTIYQVSTLRDASFIRSIIEYVPDFKLSSRLKGRKGALPYEEFKQLKILPESVPFDKRGNLTIVVHNSSLMTEAEKTVKLLHGQIITAEDGILRIAIAPTVESLEKIASLRSVKWIEPYVPPSLSLDVSAGIINAPVIWNTHGLKGEGQIVAVADTGLDTGKNDATMHPDIRGRIVNIVPLGRPGDARDTPLPPGPGANEGHGTHVAGTVLGDGASSGGTIRGIAHGARLFFQSIMDSTGGLGGIPGSLRNLFQPAFAAGARVHSNSWGSTTNGLYDSGARQLDDFVWNNRDMIIVFAAGNEGRDASPVDGIVDLDSTNSPSTAKNCITVGASENNKPFNNITYAVRISAARFPAAPLRNDPFADNPEGMAAFSSRGPTDPPSPGVSGRIKPEVTAPGTSILATKSSLTTDTSTDGKSPNPSYMFLSGTSMATPHVSGAAALARERLSRLDPDGDDNFHWRKRVKDLSPTAAFVKAVLINGADRMLGQYAAPKNDSGGDVPNNHQGFGRINLEKSLFPSSPAIIESFDGDRLDQNQRREYQFKIESNTVPLKTTLAWTDFPGSQLVNDLTLVVHTPDDQEFHGNFHGPQTSGSNLDHTNNVEQVVIAKPTPGVYRMEIIGETVSQNAPGGQGQDYGLVIAAHISSTLEALHHKPSESFPENPGPLPAIRLCNKFAPFNPVQGEGHIGRGDDRSDLVKHLQQMLRDLGFPLGNTGPEGDGVDGIFGSRTEEAVNDFQKDHKDWEGKALKVDRKVGPRTSDSLNRAMVGIWYDQHRTSTELTQGPVVITMTRAKFEEGLSINTEDSKQGVKIIVVERGSTHSITLLDPEGGRFSWEGQGKFKVLDKDEKVIDSGTATKDDEIKFVRKREPNTVELEAQKTFFTFYVRPGTDSSEEEEESPPSETE